MQGIRPKDEDVYAIQENNQKALRGLLWGGLGATLITGTLLINAATIAAIVATVFSAIGLIAGLPKYVFPGMLALSLVSLAVDYIAIRFTSFCFSNAIYHLGPQFQIVRKPNQPNLASIV